MADWLDTFEDGQLSKREQEATLNLGAGPLKSQNPYLVPEYNQPMVGNTILPDINRPQLEGTNATEYKMGADFDGKNITIPSVVGGQYLGMDNAAERYRITGERFKEMNDPSSYSKYYDTMSGNKALGGWLNELAEGGEVTDPPYTWNDTKTNQISPQGPIGYSTGIGAVLANKGIEQKRNSMLQSYLNETDLDKRNKIEQQFEGQFKEHPRAYLYKNDAEYRKSIDIKNRYGEHQSGSINYPMDSPMNKSAVSPNMQWMNPNLSGESQAHANAFHNEAIALALPLPGIDKMGKIPGLFSGLSKTTKGISKVDDFKPFESSHIVPDKNTYNFHNTPYKIDKRQTAETLSTDKNISNWFNNKDTYKKFIDYDGDKKGFQNLVDNINNPSFVEKGTGPGAGFLSDEGVSFAWDPTNKSLRTSEHIESVKNTLIHEKHHQSKIVASKREDSLLPKLWDDIDNLTGYSKTPLSEYKSIGHYLNSPTEVYSRIGEIRKVLGVKPGEKVTEKMMEKSGLIIKNSKDKITSTSGILPPLYNKNTNAWLDIINKAPVVGTAVAGTSALGIISSKKANGGWLDNIQ